MQCKGAVWYKMHKKDRSMFYCGQVGFKVYCWKDYTARCLQAAPAAVACGTA